MEVVLPSGWMYDPSVFQYPIYFGEQHLEVTLLPEYELGDCYVKVGKEINVSKYKTINLVYDLAKIVGNFTLEFGVYDTLNPHDSSGKTVMLSNGSNYSSGIRVSIDVSDLSGIKYVGFMFIGNADTHGSASYGSIDIRSITAIEREGDISIHDGKGNIYIHDSIGEYNPYQVLIYDGADWNQYIPYIRTESGWEAYSG